ncbi:hypothetical protein ABW19_dt0200131 [Dactylella cylindrospora]|nr:hypothetical protein ABW19_dt0200131 [Dactylella cylindrospora]
MRLHPLVWATCAVLGVAAGSDPALPVGPPQPAPDYMMNYERNIHHAAPDKRAPSGLATPWQNLTKPANNPRNIIDDAGVRAGLDERDVGSHHLVERADEYWVSNIKHGLMPFTRNTYKFYRNVKDYGAKGDGRTDDTEAINRAVADGERCGQDCGSTTVLGALVYFPAGTYIISSPIIQCYYSQFIGNPNDRPVIKGAPNFSGIALIDADPYIPDGEGRGWYINQNQFYRQIRNFVLDLTDMPNDNASGGQQYVATGLHWQVSQATSLQNIDFKMPVSGGPGSTSHVGIFMENGSGGFVSDLNFTGGNIGFRAGSQQFTARNLQFTQCLTAISMIWDWGFNWQDITVTSCTVAIDCSANGDPGAQGTGSILVLDSRFSNVATPIITRSGSGGRSPNIVIDNLLVEGTTKDIVYGLDGESILEGTLDGSPLTIKSWAIGRRYTNTDGTGAYVAGHVDPAPSKPEGLLGQSGKYFTRSRPQYENLAASEFIIATDHDIMNDGSGDQSAAINSLLENANGRPVFFPAGIYQVKGTVFVPVGTRMVGEGWSQIMGYDDYFNDEHEPKVMVK